MRETVFCFCRFVALTCQNGVRYIYAGKNRWCDARSRSSVTPDIAGVSPKRSGRIELRRPVSFERTLPYDRPYCVPASENSCYSSAGTTHRAGGGRYPPG